MKLNIKFKNSSVFLLGISINLIYSLVSLLIKYSWKRKLFKKLLNSLVLKSLLLVVNILALLSKSFSLALYLLNILSKDSLDITLLGLLLIELLELLLELLIILLVVVLIGLVLVVVLIKLRVVVVILSCLIAKYFKYFPKYKACIG